MSDEKTNNLLQAIYNVNYLHGYVAGLDAKNDLDIDQEVYEVFEKTIERLTEELQQNEVDKL